MKRTVAGGVSRREFLAASLGGAALLTEGARGLWARALAAGGARAALPRAGDAPWLGASIAELQRLMRRGELTSRELTRAYLGRIRELNPLLHAVIETNPDALAIAGARDAERRRNRTRGPLHGIPILLKDNIATADRMETTAGSLALVGSRVRRDARLVTRLREAGAVILGKANLSEWANFRGYPPPDFPFATNFLNGWSARGGFTLDPYLLSFDPCGSSSGSASATAANMCAAAIGTETDGSIVCPSGNNLLVGLKPTVGLISGEGIIPIAHSQDSAGPMARSTRDVAVLLNAMARRSLNGRRTPRDYEEFLDKRALRGARIGVERRLFEPDNFADPDIAAVVESAIEAMRAEGAVIVDPVDTGDPGAWSDAEFTVLLYEFKHDIEEYLGRLRNTSMRTLGDLIEFNRQHCEEELKYFGQQIFEEAEATGGNLADPVYLDARALGLRLTREEGIDRVMREHALDAVVSPSFGWGASAPAVAGYPVINVPVGFTADGRPAGAVLYAGALQEGSLLAISYALETLLQVHTPPNFAGAAPPEPPDAGLCGAPVLASRAAEPSAIAPATERGRTHHTRDTRRVMSMHMHGGTR